MTRKALFCLSVILILIQIHTVPNNGGVGVVVVTEEVIVVADIAVVGGIVVVVCGIVVVVGGMVVVVDGVEVSVSRWHVI